MGAWVGLFLRLEVKHTIFYCCSGAIVLPRFQTSTGPSQSLCSRPLLFSRRPCRHRKCGRMTPSPANWFAGVLRPPVRPRICTRMDRPCRPREICPASGTSYALCIYVYVWCSSYSCSLNVRYAAVNLMKSESRKRVFFCRFCTIHNIFYFVTARECNLISYNVWLYIY